MNLTTQKQTSKAPFQNLDAISGLKEISDGAAATCSGGGGSITLFEDDKFKGDATVRDENDRNLKNGPFKGWNDRTSSVVVNSGKWELYQKADYDDSGWSVTLGVGRYNLAALEKKGFKNDSLSSIRQVQV